MEVLYFDIKNLPDEFKKIFDKINLIKDGCAHIFNCEIWNDDNFLSDIEPHHLINIVFLSCYFNLKNQLKRLLSLVNISTKNHIDTALNELLLTIDYETESTKQLIKKIMDEKLSKME